MRKFALLSNQGTAMAETLLTEDELANRQARAIAFENADNAGDWDGSTAFTDVTDNDFFDEED